MGCCSSTPQNAAAVDGVVVTLPCAILPAEHRIVRRALPLIRAPQTRATLAVARERVRIALGGAAGAPTGSCTVIPHALRWWAYQHLSGGAELEASYPGLYRLLLRLGPSSTQDLTIRFDAHRTFPYMPFFGTAARPGPGQSQIYRIASAYSHLDAVLGYTQGCNFLIALLLLAGLSEEAAFYAFAGLMLRLRLRLFYVHGLPLAMTALAALDSLLRTRAPLLHDHLEAQSVLPVLYATPWLLSFWVSSPLPASTLLCLLDLLLLEAPPLLPELPPIVGRAYAAAIEAEGARSRTAGVTSTEAGAALAPPQLTSSVPEPTTVLDLPPVYLRVCLALVLVHSDALLAAEDTDSVYAIIKDEYAPLPLRLHRRASDASADAATATASRRHRGSTVDSVGSGGPRTSGDASAAEATPVVVKPALALPEKSGLKSVAHSRRGSDWEDSGGGNEGRCGAPPRVLKPLASALSLADGSIVGHEVAALPPFVPALAPDPAFRSNTDGWATVAEAVLPAAAMRSVSRAEPPGGAVSAAPERSAYPRSLSAGSVVDVGRRRSATATRRPFPTVTVAFRALSASVTAAAAAAKRSARAELPRGRARRRWSFSDTLSRRLASCDAPPSGDGCSPSVPREPVGSLLLLSDDPPWASGSARRHSDPTGAMSPGCNRTESRLHPARPLPAGLDFTRAGVRGLPPSTLLVQGVASSASAVMLAHEPVLPEVSHHEDETSTAPNPLPVDAVVSAARAACESAPAVIRPVNTLPAGSSALSSAEAAPTGRHTLPRRHWHFPFGSEKSHAPAAIMASGSGASGSSADNASAGREDGVRGAGGGRHRRAVSRLPSAPMLKPPVGAQRQAAPAFALRPEESMRDFGSASMPQQRRRGGARLGSPSGGALIGRASSAESPVAIQRECVAAAGGPTIAAVLQTPSGRNRHRAPATPPALAVSAAVTGAAAKSASASPPMLSQTLVPVGGGGATPTTLLPGCVHAPRRLAIFEPSDGCSLADWLQDEARIARESALGTPLGASATALEVTTPPQPPLDLGTGGAAVEAAATAQESPPVAPAPLPEALAPRTSASRLPLAPPPLDPPATSAAPAHISSLVRAVDELRSGGSDSSEEENLAGGARVAPSVPAAGPIRTLAMTSHGLPRGPDNAWSERRGRDNEPSNAPVPRPHSFSAAPSRSAIPQLPPVGGPGGGPGSFHIHVSGRGWGGGSTSARSHREATPTPNAAAPLPAPPLRPQSSRIAFIAAAHSSDLPMSPSTLDSTPVGSALPLPGAALSPKSGADADPPAPLMLARVGDAEGEESLLHRRLPQQPQASTQSGGARSPRDALLLAEDNDLPSVVGGVINDTGASDAAETAAAAPVRGPSDSIHEFCSPSDAPASASAVVGSPPTVVRAEASLAASEEKTLRPLSNEGTSRQVSGVSDGAAILRTSEWVCDGKPCSEWALPRLFLARLRGRDVAVRPSDVKSLL